MTLQEILEELPSLSPGEQQTLLAHLLTAMGGEARPTRREALDKLRTMRGVLRPAGELPSDEELRADYRRYLEEKYR